MYSSHGHWANVGQVRHGHSANNFRQRRSVTTLWQPSCARNTTYVQRAQNVPITLWNVGLNDSLVNVPKTCQQRCEINIYLYHDTLTLFVI